MSRKKAAVSREVLRGGVLAISFFRESGEPQGATVSRNDLR